MQSERNDSQSVNAPKAFLTTRWSIVIRAGAGDEEAARQALEDLCQNYWRPLFEFARRKGHSREDAQDLTQGFIERLLETNALSKAQSERGRFRTFLLSSFINYMIGEHRGRTSLKRGRGLAICSLDDEMLSKSEAFEDRDQVTPERAYERSMAAALLDRVAVRLHGEYEQAGRLMLFDSIRPFLTGVSGRSHYGKLGMDIGMSESAIAVSVHRMRKRYGQLLRDEVAAIVATPEDVEDELRYLIGVVSRELS